MILSNLKMKALLTAFAAAAVSPVVFAQDSGVPMAEENSGLAAYAGMDFASAYIDDLGSVFNDSFNIQPYFGFSLNIFDAMPVEFSAWGNYSVEDNPDQTKSSCFTEIDLTVGISHDFDCGFGAAGEISTWQYPNIRDSSGEELVMLDVHQSLFNGFLTVGTAFEFMISGDCKKDIHWLPYATLEHNVTDGICVSLTGQIAYLAADSDDEEDGFANYNVTAKLSLFETVFASVRYWGQIDDDVYTDEVHDFENVVYSAGFSVDF